MRQHAYQIATDPLDGAATKEPVVDIPYLPPSAGLPVETFSLSSLLERRPQPDLESRQRLHFELLVCCRSGSGSHEVDFQDVDLSPGRILHVRPGQVHRWKVDPPYEADLIILRPLDTRWNWAPGPHVITTDAQLERDLQTLKRFTDPSRSIPLPAAGLKAVRDLFISVLRLDSPEVPEANSRASIYAEFERLMARTEPPPRSVHRCAELLGCSARTLTRACQSVAGVAPKELIDNAIALEAQRRLSVGGRSATAVAASLGFGELSHFSRFFTRVTGESPSVFASNSRN